MPHTRLAAALFAALSLAACDGLTGPAEQSREQIIFLRYARAGVVNAPFDSTDIYRMNADGTGLQNLTAHPAWYGPPSVSPDGRSVIVQSNRGDGLSHVWLMSTDGTGARQLTTGISYDARWSPDGSRIAVEMAPGLDGLHVYVMNADGSNPRKVSAPAMQVGSSCNTGNETGTRIDLIGWIPDGRVAFSRHYCGFGYRFFTVNADGSGFAQTDINLNEVFWSPDGSKAVFARREGDQWRVMVMNADGSGARVLSTHGTQQYLPWSGSYSPWSPDGRRILFFADNAPAAGLGRGCSASSPPYVVNVDGTGVQRLMDFCGGEFNGWSPSGDRVVFTSAPEFGVRDVYVANTDGSGAQNLTSSPFWESSAQWVPR